MPRRNSKRLTFVTAALISSGTDGASLSKITIMFKIEYSASGKRSAFYRFRRGVTVVIFGGLIALVGSRVYNRIQEFLIIRREIYLEKTVLNEAFLQMPTGTTVIEKIAPGELLPTSLEVWSPDWPDLFVKHFHGAWSAFADVTSSRLPAQPVTLGLVRMLDAAGKPRIGGIFLESVEREKERALLTFVGMTFELPRYPQTRLRLIIPRPPTGVGGIKLALPLHERFRISTARLVAGDDVHLHVGITLSENKNLEMIMSISATGSLIVTAPIGSEMEPSVGNFGLATWIVK